MPFSGDILKTTLHLKKLHVAIQILGWVFCYTQVNEVFNYRMNYYSTVCGFETFNYDLKQRESIEV